MTTHEKQLSGLINKWANQEAKIRRVWIRTTLTGSANHTDIAVEIEPVNDSEEELLLWMAKSHDWQVVLQNQISGTVQLECIDPYASTGEAQHPDTGYRLLYERNQR